MKKDVKSKGGGREMAVMICWWQKNFNNNSGEFVLLSPWLTRFKLKDDGLIEGWKKVICRQCSSTIGYSRNTSNLTYHLEKRHPDLFTAFKEKQRINEQKTEGSSSSNSKSLWRFHSLCRVWISFLTPIGTTRNYYVLSQNLCAWICSQ